MKKVLIGGVLGGAALFLWGFVYWTQLGITQSVMRTLPNEPAVVAALEAGATGSGVYAIPGFHVPAMGELEMYADSVPEMREPEEVMRLQAEGPYGMVILVPDGVDMQAQMGATLATGFLLDFLAAALVAWVLVQVGARAGYGRRVAVAASFGVVMALVGPLISANYMAWPAEFAAMMAVDYVVGWILAALVIAAAVRPAAASARA